MEYLFLKTNHLIVAIGVCGWPPLRPAKKFQRNQAGRHHGRVESIADAVSGRRVDRTYRKNHARVTLGFLVNSGVMFDGQHVCFRCGTVVIGFDDVNGSRVLNPDERPERKRPPPVEVPFFDPSPSLHSSGATTAGMGKRRGRFFKCVTGDCFPTG